MKKNIFQIKTKPVAPGILRDERLFVYVPKATSDNAGVASFPTEEFTVDNKGEVNLKWDFKLQIENDSINNPIKSISRVKLQDNEFVNTKDLAIVRHPITGQLYSNKSSSVKLKRTDQNLYNKPGLIMVDNEDFIQDYVDSDDSADVGKYVKYKLKENDPFEKATIVRLSQSDFSYGKDSLGNRRATINWAFAHDPTTTNGRTNGFGLVKIRGSSVDYLKFENEHLAVDKDKLFETTSIVPLYGGLNNGFVRPEQFMTDKGFAKRDNDGRTFLKLTKDAIGLSNVENKAFRDYDYIDFGIKMKNSLNKEFVDSSKWNALFSDWSAPNGTTVQSILNKLERIDDSVIQALRSTRGFVGYFDNIDNLENLYPASEKTYGMLAFVFGTNSYWQISKVDDVYSWKDTHQNGFVLSMFFENDITQMKENGVPSVGNSGKVAQSNHVHPKDSTKLDKTVFDSVRIRVTSDVGSNSNNFVTDLANGGDKIINIPYVRTSKTIYNYQGNQTFDDSTNKDAYYWCGSRNDFENEKDSSAPGTFFIVDDEYDNSVESVVEIDDIENHGIRLNSQYDRFVLAKSNDVDELTNKALTLVKERANDGKSDRYYLKNLTFSSNNLISADESGNLTSSNVSVDSILKVPHNLSSGKILIGASNSELDVLDLGNKALSIVVTDGNGAIRPISFGKAGYLLETSGDNGDSMRAEIDVNTLVRTNADEFNRKGFVVSNGSGRVERFDFGDLDGKLVVTDGNSGLKLANLESGKLLWLDESTDKVSVFPSTKNDVGKVLMVQPNGKISLSSIPEMENNLPVTSETLNGRVGFRLSFVKTNVENMVDGVLYLW